MLFGVTVCLGPENATEVIMTIFRGVDWVSTSHFRVTISKYSGSTVTFTLTHSRLVLNPLSFYLRLFVISYVLLSYA